MFMAPIGWNWALLGFLIFRLLDIFKPWPINYIDKRLKGGLGVMLDDAIAGGMSALCIQALMILTG
jgi:phosphatidylglycerophosphatase A